MLAGNVVYAACQWGAIVALAKLGSSFIIGQFSLGLAIATPVLMFTNLHLRAVQATDARRLTPFAEYLRLRTAMTLCGLAVICAIAWFGNYQPQTTLVILAVALAKAIETISDIHYGLFQLNDRLDETGRSMMLRGLLSVFALATGLYLTRNVLWGCILLALVWLAALLGFDVPRGRRFAAQAHQASQRAGRSLRQWKLMRTALPLGIATTLAALNLNMPRYFIHSRLGERSLGIYSAMAYTTVAMILVADSLGHCAIPRLVEAVHCGALCGIPFPPAQTTRRRSLPGAFWTGSGPSHRRPPARPHLRPGVRRSLPDLPRADSRNGHSLCCLHVHQRHHLRTLFPHSGTALHPRRRSPTRSPARVGYRSPGWPAAPPPWRSPLWSTSYSAPPSWVTCFGFRRKAPCVLPRRGPL